MGSMFTAKSSVLASSIAAVLAANSAMAQSTLVLEEVIVTATKRAVNLQDVPLSVTSVQGDTLIALGVESVVTMEKTTPGMKIRVVGNTPSIVMRGAGSAGTTDVAVPIYNDGLYRPRSAQGLASFIDIDRVEILRGPQGTLFGRNTLGGLVNVITVKPDTEEMSYGGAFTAGDYGLRKFEGFVNVPLTDKVALRIVGTDTERDPYVENTYDSGGGLKDADSSYFRGQLNFDISDTMNLNLTAGYWKDTANGAGDFGHKVMGIPVNPTTRQTNGLSGVLDIRQGLRDDWGGGKNTTGSISDGDLSAFISSDPREVAFDFRPNRDLEEDSFSALFKWDLGFAELKANIGYADYESTTMIDGDFSIAGAYRSDNVPKGYVSGEWGTSESLQVDINLTSLSDGPLRWTAGYYNFDEESSYAWIWGETTNQNNPQDMTWAHWIHGSESTVESQALYGQAEYDFTEDLTVTVGLRYSEDERTSEGLSPVAATLGNNSGPSFSTEPYPHWRSPYFNEGDDDTVDYRVAAQYNISDDVMVFASASTGYISGKTQSTTGNLLDGTEVDSYEIGVKSTLLDGAMTLNATYYQADYKGLTTSLLVLVNNVFTSDSVPGGDMDSSGVEVDMVWQPIENLKVTGGLALDNSEFGKFRKQNPYTEDDGLASDGFYDLKGEDTPYSPDMTLNLGVSYQISLDRAGTIVPGIFVYYSDDYKTTPVDYFWSKQDSYTTVDLSVKWYSADDMFTVQAYVNNATDEDVITGTDSYSGARAVADFNDPRVWGIRAAYDF